LTGAYCIDIGDVREIDEGVVAVEPCSAGYPVRVSGVVSIDEVGCMGLRVL